MISLILLLSFKALADDNLDKILEQVKSSNRVVSEEGHAHITTKSIVEKAEKVLKDEYYNFFFKDYQKHKIFLFKDEELADVRFKMTLLPEGDVKKERFQKNKGYQIISSGEDSKNLWGIDMNDFDFSSYNKENFDFSMVASGDKKFHCPTTDKEEADLVKGRPKTEKDYSTILLHISKKYQNICQVSFFKSNNNRPFKVVRVVNFREHGKISRPGKVEITEARRGNEVFKAEMVFQGIKIDKVSDQIFQ